MSSYTGSVLEVTNTYPSEVVLALEGFDYSIKWPVGIEAPPVASRVKAHFKDKLCTKIQITNSSNRSWINSEITWTGDMS
jgi:hypothetical protein